MVKKLILIGFLLTLLIGIPLALFVLQNQTQPTIGAAPLTKFSFDGPTQVDLNQTFQEKIAVDPTGGTTPNQISFVKFTFTYDSNFLDKASAQPVTIDSTYTVLEQPTVNCSANICTVTATLSVGQNTSAIIKTKTNIATMNFISKANTDAASPTQLAWVSGQNQALSVGSADQPAENVYNGGVPLSINIGASAAGPSGTPTPTSTLLPGPSGTGTGGTGTGTGGTGTGAGTGGSLSVTCTSLTPDKTTGNSPLAVTFTTIGSSTTDSISKIDINYGDGAADTVASGSGIGTGNVNNQITHTYASNGTFNAQATLTTTGGATSDPSTCKTTINVGVSPTPIAKLPPTGPGQTILLIGGAGLALSVVGGLVLLGL